MHTMLIVDNEKIIVDGLSEFFSGLKTMELEVHGAYSGKEAVSLLETIKFDVVLSDIRMPGMSGLELQREVMLRWPRCKVVFLTGYDEFDYAHQAIRNGASNYILKTEGYETIAETVSKVLDELNESVRLDHFLSSAKKQLQASLPLVQKEFMQGILMADPASHRSRERQFRDLQIDLRGDEQVLLLIGRVDEWREAAAPSDKALMTFAIQNISEEFLKSSVSLHCFAYEPSRIVWAIQPRQTPDFAPGEDLQKRALRFVQFTLQDIQSACKGLLKLPVSFAVGASFVEWEGLPEQFESLKLLLNFGLGTGRETILLDSPFTRMEEEGQEASVLQLSVHLLIRKLHSHMENGERSEFFSRLTEMMNAAFLRTAHRKSVRLEVMMSLSAMFLSFINRWNLQQEIGASVPLDLLTKWDADKAWNEYIDVVCRTAETLFDAQSMNQVHQEQDMVTKIQSYVESRLADELSLTKIGEAFGHHPYYLSRLYKQITDKGLSEYIAEVRFNKAKELLRHSNLRIHEISEAVGFLSEKYFYRFFKKSAGVTPQEFRDAYK